MSAALLAACGVPSAPGTKPAEPAIPAEPAKPAEAAKPAAEAPKPVDPSRAQEAKPAAAAATPAPAAKAAPGKLVGWKFGGTAAELEYFPKWNEEFTKKTNIALEYSNNDWAVKREKVLAAFQAKRISDVLLFDGQSIPDLSALGVIVPYDDLDKTLLEKWKPNFIPEIWNSTLYKGKSFGPVPYVDTGTFLAYNKQMFADAGISKVPENWDELRDAAKKLTKGEVAGITLSISTHTNDANTLEGIAYANGGRWLDDSGQKVLIGEPGFVDVLQLYVDLVNDKSVPQGFTDTAFNQSAVLFFEGKAAMWATLSYPRAIMQSQKRPDDFPIGMTLFPRQPKPSGSAKPAATIMTPTATFLITSLSQQHEAALKYTDFWTQPEVQAGWDGSAVRGRVPGLKANWESATFKQLYPDWSKLHQEGKMFDGALPMPAFPGLVEAEKALSTAMQQAVLGRMTAKDALAAAAKRAQTIVDEFKF